MDFKLYQQMAKRTMPNDTHRDKLTNFSMGLCEEAGETVSHIKKHLFHGHGLDRLEVEEEMGDVLWYLFNLATELGIDMSRVAELNHNKLFRRYPDGFDQDKSINREL
mgnify:CR=1 FL=1